MKYWNSSVNIIVLIFFISEGSVDHAKAGGRIAFACPSDQLKGIEAAVKEAGNTILTPFISLDTPGKATVQVVILADPVSRIIFNVLISWIYSSLKFISY